MDNQIDASRQFTIREVSDICGLPESTLRYYETIGLIKPIHRDNSSKHRVYTEDDVTFAEIIACLNATGMSLEDMRSYFKNRSQGVQGADEQIALLERHKKRLFTEENYIKLRQKYVESKIAYWKAVKAGDQEQAKTIKDKAYSLSKKLQQSKELNI